MSDKADKVVLSGTVAGPFEQEFSPACAFCGADLTGRVHATAIISHALDECRVRLKDQRDEAQKKSVQLEDVISNLRVIVDDLQWSSSSQDSEMSPRVYRLCPWCGRTEDLGHSASCEIGLALADVEPAK